MAFDDYRGVITCGMLQRQLLHVRGADAIYVYILFSLHVLSFRLFWGRYHPRDAGPMYIMLVSYFGRSNFVLNSFTNPNIGQTHLSTLKF